MGGIKNFLSDTSLQFFIHKLSLHSKIFAFVIILPLNTVIAQGVLTVTTDKTSYGYGDSIVVRVTVSNKTNTPFTLIGSSTCIARIKFNDVRFQTMCTTDQHEFYFSPGMSRSWIWYLKPSELGIPDKDDVQKIVGLCNNLKDSVYINAPKFRGGKIYIGKKPSVPEIEYQKLRDSIGATIISQTTYWSEYWSIKNHSIDSLVEKYSRDYRINSIEAERPLQFNKEIVTSVGSRENLPLEYSLSQNYPNPFNPETVISYQLSVSSFVTLKVFDLLGCEVVTLINEYQLPGKYNSQFSIFNSQLPSGIYFYRLQTGNYSATKKMILLK